MRSCVRGLDRVFLARFEGVDARRFVERTLSLMASRAFRFPRTEKALFCSGLVSLLTSSWTSQGKPGGDEGGLELRSASSEKHGRDEGLEDAVASEDGTSPGIIVATSSKWCVWMSRDFETRRNSRPRHELAPRSEFLRVFTLSPRRELPKAFSQRHDTGRYIVTAR